MAGGGKKTIVRRLLAGCALLAADAAMAEEPPSIELLEFLAEWQTGDGEWLDPAVLEDVVPLPEPGEERDVRASDAQAD